MWSSADMVLKVKEPQPSEFRYFREDLILFTYLHLAAGTGTDARADGEQSDGDRL